MLDIYEITSGLTSVLVDKFPELAKSSYDPGIYFDYAPESSTKPFIRFSIVDDNVSGAYTGVLINSVDIQFSAFCTTMAEASGIIKSIGDIFNRQQVALPPATDEYTDALDYISFGSPYYAGFTSGEYLEFVSSLALESNIFISGQIIGGTNIKVERYDTKPNALIYHGIVNLRFRIQSQS